jgi:hypothetical protein
VNHNDIPTLMNYIKNKNITNLDLIPFPDRTANLYFDTCNNTKCEHCKIHQVQHITEKRKLNLIKLINKSIVKSIMLTTLDGDTNENEDVTDIIEWIELNKNVDIRIDMDLKVDINKALKFKHTEV